MDKTYHATYDTIFGRVNPVDRFLLKHVYMRHAREDADGRGLTADLDYQSFRALSRIGVPLEEVKPPAPSI